MDYWLKVAGHAANRSVASKNNKFRSLAVNTANYAAKMASKLVTSAKRAAKVRAHATRARTKSKFVHMTKKQFNNKKSSSSTPKKNGRFLVV
jgi:hypothetical protein